VASPADAAASWPSRPPVADEVARRLLREGEPELLGRMPWSSNATFLVCLTLPGEAGQLLAVYKPRQGERPLWDFPAGTLCQREVAAGVVSDVLGWEIVPDTILRDGPLGPGMVQRFVDHDPEQHYFTLLPDHADDFRRFAAFDVVLNNTDRKGGHCVRDPFGHVWGVDHGIAFHVHWKLRTVIWEFAGEPLAPPISSDLERFLGALDGEGGAALAELLSPAELIAVQRRTEDLLGAGHLPEPDDGYHSMPWPLV